MSNKTFPLSNFPSENSNMTFTAEAVRAEMRQHVSDVVALAPDDNRKAAFAFAARLLGIPYGRVRCLFYGIAHRIEAHEADRIRAYVQAAENMIKARADYEALRREFVTTAHPIVVRAAKSLGLGEALSEEMAESKVGEGRGR